MFKIFFDNIKKSEFASNFKILASGIFISQFIMIASSPVITRLYSPSEFGIYALFTAILGIIIPVACGRYDIATIVVKEDTDGNELFFLSLIVGLIISTFLFLVFFLDSPLREILNADKLDYWWYILPVTIFLQSVFTNLKSYANRYKNYSIISSGQIAFALSQVILLTLFGLMGFSSFGLFVSYITSSIIVLIILFLLYKNFFLKSRWPGFKKLLIIAKRYIKFPLIQGSSTLFNTVRFMLPVIFLTKYFPDIFVGYYALVMKVIFFPLTFFSKSISRLNMKKIAELVHKKINPTNYLIKITFIVFIIIFFPSIIIMKYGPNIFSFVFGSKWIMAGEFASILMPGLFCMFIASTLGQVFAATGRLYVSGFWYVSFFIVQLIFFVFFAKDLEINQVLYFLSCLNVIFYLIFYIIICYAIYHPKKI